MTARVEAERAIADVLSAHVIPAKGSGGTASGSYCVCSCGERNAPRSGLRDDAAKLAIRHVASVLADLMAERQAEAWDECCKGFAWALDNGTDEQAVMYVRDHNRYRPDPKDTRDE